MSGELQYRLELVQNVTVLVVRVCGVHYKEELVQNVTVLVLNVWGVAV